MKRASVVLLILFLSLSAFAQKHANDALGFHPEKLYDFSQTDAVNALNGNLIVTIPIGLRQHVGGSLSYQLTLVYNGLIWDSETYDCEPHGVLTRCTDILPNLRSNAGLGWRLSLGRLLAPTEPSAIHSSLDRYTYLYEGPSGDEHAFNGVANVENIPVQYTSDPYSEILRLIKISNVIRDVEFGSGEVHRFTFIANAWRITQMRDRFGNVVSIAYTFDSNQRETTWTITDTSVNSPPRTHTINFAHFSGMQDGWSRGQMITSITMDAIGGADATWNFVYLNTGGSGPNALAPVLTAISQPDGTQYAFEYHNTAEANGSLKKLRYPTGGAVSYTYQEYRLPEPDVCLDGSFAGVQVFPRPGVATRTISDGSTDRVSTYVQRRGPKVPVTYNNPHDPCGNNQYIYGPFYWTRTSIVGPMDTNNRRVRTDHYFSAMGAFEGTLTNPLPGSDSGSNGHTGTVGMPPLAYARGSLSTIPEETPGYPADVSASDGTRYLSTQIFGNCDAAGDCTNGTLLRSEYHLYSGAVAAWRLTNVRTVHEDDLGCRDAATPVPCYTQWTLSGPNGVGNHATRTATSNFPNARSGTTTTVFPQWTVNDLFNASKPFILTIYSDRTQSEEGAESVREQFDFSTTGFLRRHRTLAGITPGPHDVLRVFTPSDHGEIQSVTIYGGDKQTLNTGADLAALPLPSAWWYKTAYTYSNGVLQSAQRYDRASQTQLMPFKDLDRSVEPFTGVITAVREITGLHTTSYGYAANPARLETITAPEGAVTALTYTNASGSPGASFTAATIASTTASGAGTVERRVVIDGVGRILRDSTKGADGRWTSRETAFDEVGRVAWTSEPEFAGTAPPTGPLAASYKTRYTYDALGRILTITPADDRRRFVTYVGSRLRRHTSAVALGSGIERNVTTTEELDAFGRLAAVTEDGVTTRYTYDVADRLTKVEMGPRSQTRVFDFDGRGFLVYEQHPELGSDGNGGTTYADYDPLGHAHRRYTGTMNGQFDLTFTYDSGERLTEVKQTASGAVLKTLVYDDYLTLNTPGRLVAAARYNPTFDLGLVTVAETYQYNGVGGRLSRRDVAVSSSVNAFAAESFSYAQTYNTLGSIETIFYPERNSAPDPRSVDYAYANGMLTGVGSYASFTYQPNGLPETITHHNASSAQNVKEKWTLDRSMTRPAEIRATNTNDQELWTTGTYQYDGNGNIKQIGGRTYEYDASNRLRATTEGGARTSYTYDEYGNYLGPEAPASPGCPQPTGPCRWLSFAPPHAIKESTNRYAAYAYDEAGNVISDGTRLFSYDPLGMLSSSSEGRQFRYIYTPGDERLALIERGIASNRNRIWWTLRGFDNELLTVWKDDTLSGTRSIVWHEDHIWRGASLLARRNTTGTFHYILDHLGSPRYITMGAGLTSYTQSFAPFGAGGTSDGGTLQFTGQERDGALATGSADLPDNFHARQYDAARGRFLAVDPVLGEPKHPQSWNRYTYALNNPLTVVDPSGMEPCIVATPELNGGEPFESDCTTVNAKDPTRMELAQSYVDLEAWGHSLRWLADRGGLFIATPTLYMLDGIENDNPSHFAIGAFGNATMALGGLGGSSPRPSVAAPDKIPVDEILANPGLLMNMTASELNAFFATMTRLGWRLERLGKGAHKGMGMVLRETDASGRLTGRTIQFHPGGGHHGRVPYWKASSPEFGRVRVFYIQGQY